MVFTDVSRLSSTNARRSSNSTPIKSNAIEEGSKEIRSATGCAATQVSSLNDQSRTNESTNRKRFLLRDSAGVSYGTD